MTTTVLLHGFLGSGRNLRTLANEWAKREPARSFVTPDLPGHGAAPAPSAETLDAIAADVLAGVPGDVELVGHSFGGRVALAAARQASRVRRVTLLDISPSPIGVSESRAVLDVLLEAPERAKDRREMRDWLVAHGLSGPLADWVVMNVGPDGAWKIDRALLDRLHRKLNDEDLWGAVDARTRLCVRGARSPYVSDADAARLEARGCRVVTLDAGHYVHVDALPALLDVLTQS